MADYSFREEETFNDALTVKDAIALAGNTEGEVTVHAFVEYERKGYTTRDPINANNCYRSSSDEYVVVIEVRLPSWEVEDSTVLADIRFDLAAREVRQIAAIQAAKRAKIAQLEQELAALKA